MPDAAPSEVAFLCMKYSISSQPRMAAIVASVVLAKVRPVSEKNWAVFSSSVAPAKTIEPTLKPYQPIQSRPAPSMVSVRLCGRMASLPKPTRLPSRMTSTRAGHTGVDVHGGAAGVVLRTDPAADERVLGAAEHHVGQREVARASAHSGTKTTQAENFIRSATAPLMSATVMIANVIWNITPM